MKNKSTKKRKINKTSKTIHRWECPEQDVFFLKAEAILLSALVFLIFIFSFLTFEQNLFPTIITTLLFIAVFLLSHYIIKKIYPSKNVYYITPEEIIIYQHRNNKKTSTKIKFHQIKQIKFDKFLHGGRIETHHKKYHPLFFNTTAELKKLEKIISKKLKKK